MVTEADVRDWLLPDSYDPRAALAECHDLWASGAWSDDNAPDNLAEVMEHTQRLLAQEAQMTQVEYQHPGVPALTEVLTDILKADPASQGAPPPPFAAYAYTFGEGDAVRVAEVGFSSDRGGSAWMRSDIQCGSVLLACEDFLLNYDTPPEVIDGWVGDKYDPTFVDTRQEAERNVWIACGATPPPWQDRWPDGVEAPEGGIVKWHDANKRAAYDDAQGRAEVPLDTIQRLLAERDDTAVMPGQDIYIANQDFIDGVRAVLNAQDRTGVRSGDHQ